MGKRRRRLWGGFLAALVLLPTAPLSAERIASRAEDTAVARQAELTQIRETLARDEVARALAARGLSAGQVEERLTRLSNEDLRRLAANLDQIQAAGEVPKYIWILLAVFLVASTLAIIF